MAEGYAVETISSLPFDMLIGAPLTAAVNAQAQGAKATVDFIQDVGFLPPSSNEDMLFPTPGALDAAGGALVPGDLGQVRTVTFTYSTTDGAGAVSTSQLTVPLLTVVPIPNLQIAEMTIDFVAKISEAITSSKKDVDNRRKDASAHTKGGWGPVSGGLKASYSSTHTSSSERSSKYQTELTMSIHVRATSESLPKGLGRVLDILASTIKPA
jgi:hypothetical protein